MIGASLDTELEDSMEEEFVPYKLALILKELGFNEKCIAFYSAYPKENRKFMFVSEFRATKKLFLTNDYGAHTITAPMWQQAFKWIEDTYGLYLDRDTVCSVNEVLFIHYWIRSINGNLAIDFKDLYDEFDTLKTRTQCLEQLIKVIKHDKDRS